MLQTLNDWLHDIITFGEQTNNITTFFVYIVLWLVVYKFIKAVNDYV